MPALMDVLQKELLERARTMRGKIIRICRSPMAAEWLGQKLAGKGWTAESAGVAAEAMADLFGLSAAAYRRVRDELVPAPGDFLLFLAERGERSR